MAVSPGQSIGRYHIIEKLGEGGMAVVYKAFDTHLECEVAVKVIRTENLPQSGVEKALIRFEREAKAVARLNHPNIVKVIDFGEFEGKPYLVMPFLDGGTLKDFLKKKGCLNWQAAVKLLLPIAEALGYAHQHNMIHRDVKPSNILLTDQNHPMLTDFGVAKILDIEDGNTLTGTGVGVGTPEYMAPEQWQGKVSVQTDVYALGVVFFEMITNNKPYIADTPAAVLIKQISEPLPRPQKFAADLPDAVEHFIYKAMAKQEADRYASMSEFIAALEQLSSGSKSTSPQPSDRSEETRIESYAEPLATVDQFTLPKEPGKLEPAIIKQREQNHHQWASRLENRLTISVGETGDFEFIRIPEGKFWMGSDPHSDKNAMDDELPQHEVFLSEYWIMRYPVTIFQYISLSQGAGKWNEHRRSADWKLQKEIPVTGVNWHDASEFCEWLSKACGYKVRLPTEAEWEKAARGNDKRIYPWGDFKPTPALANFAKNSSYLTSILSHPLGESPFGIQEMSGNVFEWAFDWYSGNYYKNCPIENPRGPEDGYSHVIKGGSWEDSAKMIRISYRDAANPDEQLVDIGFRCVIEGRGKSPVKKG